MLTLVLLAALAGAPRDVSKPPERGQDGRVVTAPVDLSTAPDALEVSHGLVWLVLADGTPAQAATKVPAGTYVTAAGMASLEASVMREVKALRAERDRLRAELAQRHVPLPGIPVAPPVVATSRGWPTGVVVAGAVLGLALGGYVGCRATGGCR